MRDNEVRQITLVEIPLGQVEDLVGKARLLVKVEEIDSEKADSEEARGRLFANEESQLVLKDEQSS